eukprot:CAMPEP_0206500506 /NCGR_PEP_ID=MMETSP0324_2-20121206/52525_1 /ASSEMBLY_ACC=CAM_ASM_000836 /TAXON_ID=2866 /ORGANISM="Crypthecodinium cohnii, Strain Seligo" /LENGTH=241 /DNA_ID=CAMNT_0053987687 /DNA_START=69 /DNA_END=794 /DNA_ORIENTATION=+
MSAAARRVLVIGAGGQLGAKLCNTLSARSWQVYGVDAFAAPPKATVPLSIPKEGRPEQQTEALVKAIQGSTPSFDAIVNVAGGFAMGSAKDDDMVANCRAMVDSSLYTSVMAAHVASKFLNPNGLLLLPGAAAALNPTAWSLPYGICKVAVHHMVRSLADVETSGLPAGTKTIGIAPITLDTPQNREAMPDADKSTWATLDEVSEQIEAWCSDPSKAESGKVYIIKKESGSKAVFDPTTPL